MPTLRINDTELDAELILFDLDGTLVDDQARYRRLAESRMKAMARNVSKEAAETWARLEGVDPESLHVDMNGPLSKAPRREDLTVAAVALYLHGHPELQNDYEPVLEKAKERNIGVIAMKSIAKGPYPTEERTRNTWYQPFTARDEIGEALRFTLSQPVTTAATSSDMEMARMQIEVAENFSPMKLEEQRGLLMKASDYRPLFPKLRKL